MDALTLPALVHNARDLAQTQLAGLPERWRHTIAVARRAEQLLGTLDAGEDDEVLVAAAWLHDIGYAEPLVDTGFHPLDGARFLDRRHWPARVVALVAHHSGAIFVARARGLEAALLAYPREHTPVSDALTYADQTVGPSGERLSLEQRLAEALHRHGPHSPNAQVRHERSAYLRAVAERVERRLADRSSP
ncbi:HDIG domain-containing protein [Planosporangium thailandense]|uniref:HDIG domain-containing protein n=1 Tax=Planosporangium thailandense TaxID=765197 RepID=A0ABX0Y3P0_9ACTN|nr:HD domain-containing protein [Planosporangium thailandense]NJC72009.1 HDIG domain-containing protein [Planosporangium thailandense]